MSSLLFLVVIGLFFYLHSLSSRLEKLERMVRGGVTPAAQEHAQMASQPTPHVAHVIEPARPQIPAHGMQRPVSDISAAQWVGGVGAIALVFGIAFFFKYAIDQGWISEWLRIGLGFVVGGLLLVLGDLWRQKYAKYSQVLSGAGLAILYFTVFAAHQFYHKLDQPIAFLAAIIITILGVALSYRSNAKALGALAIAGAYVSPLLVGFGDSKGIGLFGYVTIVNIGVLLMLLRGYWTELLFLAMLGTGLDFSIWALEFSTKANTGTSVAFLVFNFLLVGILTATIFRKFHEAQKTPTHADVHLGIFYAILGIAMHGTITGLLYDSYQSYIAPVLLLLAVITFLSYAILDRLEYTKINYPMSLVGAKFLVAAILWQFGGNVENIYLLAAASLGIGIGFLVKRKDLRVWGLILLLVSVFKILVADYNLSEFVFIFNARFGMHALTAALLLVAAVVYDKLQVEGDEMHVPAITRGIAAAVVWLAGSEELLSQFAAYEDRNTRNLLLSVWWMVYAVILTALGGLHGMRIFRKAALALFVLTVLKVFLYDVRALELGYRVVSFILLGVILLCVAFVYQRNKDKLQKFWEGEAEVAKPTSNV